ncbi:MAG: response regulator [Candidatus Thermofonsia Clade 1 bacterium]|uniref:Response regulator n=1 Tax=Candidatus Thermofonsia Clade 1 bacterium TaxID=2364210 RepID=A0A2M8PI13_9CHLR|nr:MAG: response regulator [Candidatus Thermofonsia Clade 1 bacterium]RMF50279.1 MAG: response regulator [Chloroflexota bacterium]
MRKLRLLIAEDDRPLANILRLVLEEEGFEVTLCSDGRRAIQTLTALRDQGAPPDIILLDLNMPYVTGWEVAAWLDADPRLQAIPVIVISATEAHGKAARALNVDAYLVKPFTTDEIIGVVSLFAIPLRRQN